MGNEQSLHSATKKDPIDELFSDIGSFLIDAQTFLDNLDTPRRDYERQPLEEALFNQNRVHTGAVTKNINRSCVKPRQNKTELSGNFAITWCEVHQDYDQCEAIKLRSASKKNNIATNAYNKDSVSLPFTWCNEHFTYDQCESKNLARTGVNQPVTSNNHYKRTNNFQIINKNGSLVYSLSLIHHKPTVRYSTAPLYEVDHIWQSINNTKHHQKIFKVISIERVENGYLKSLYELKRLEMKRNGNVREELLYHGTTAERCDMICRDNFDWRKNGERRGTKYGRGVNFAPTFGYAHFFCDKKAAEKTMLLCRVLIGKKQPGSEGMDIPASGYDTTVRDNGMVVVKYSDDEFYPEYKIRFQVKWKRACRKVYN